MAVQKYDIRRPAEEGGEFEERFWSPLNSPVFSSDGRLAYVVHQVVDVTDFVRLKRRGDEQAQLEHEMRGRAQEMESEIYRRAQEIQSADLMMPGVNGLEFLRLLRANPSCDEIPVLVLTAKADDETRRTVIRSGAQDYLSKPFYAEEPQARVGNLVELRCARAALARRQAAA